jgi:hypothetical protein
MIIEVRGHIFPKVWEIANHVRKIRQSRRTVNLGSNSISYNVYEVDLPDDSKISGCYITTPQGVRLYHSPGDQYGMGYLISELDDDRLVNTHFKNTA